MTQSGPDLGEQALSKVAEVGLSSQLDEAEELNVDIRTNPLKLIQGEVDSVAIEGKGLVMQQDLRMESVEVSTDTVAINPLSTVMGKIELTQPASADARIVLTEDDLNRALNSSYLRDKMQNLTVEVNGQPLTVDTQQAQLRLMNDGKINLDADVLVQQTGETQQFSMIATPHVRENGQRIALENVVFNEDKGLSLELATALFEKVMELLDLRNFDLKGMDLQFKGLKVEQGQLTFQTAATIEKFPSA